jgi:hypothetical protein
MGLGYVPRSLNLWFQVLLEWKAEIALFKIELESKLRVLSCFKQVQIL